MYIKLCPLQEVEGKDYVEKTDNTIYSLNQFPSESCFNVEFSNYSDMICSQCPQQSFLNSLSSWFEMHNLKKKKEML